jgi:hypothetical protein
MTEYPSTRRLWFVWGTLVILCFVAHLAHGFAQDELQHLHFAWNVGQGWVPYRDFFEHHPPLFHYLLAPFIRHQTEANTATLVTTRWVAFGIVVVLIAVCYALLRQAASREAACCGIGAWILTHPFENIAYELRPDGLGFVCFFGALLLLFRSISKESGMSVVGASLSGLLLGLGACFTQKVGLLMPGILLWLLGVVWFARYRFLRWRRGHCLLGVAIGFVVPPLILAYFFISHQAGRLLLENTLLINFKWPRELSWRSTIQESLLISFGLFALGFAELAHIGRALKQHISQATPASLVAILLVCGVLVFMSTPAPYGQAFLYFVTPWAAYLGTLAMHRYTILPAEMRQDRWWLVGAACFVLVGLKWHNALVAIVGWGVLSYCGAKWICRELSPNRRLIKGFVLLLALSILMSLAHIVDSFSGFRRSSQERLMSFVSVQLAPGEPVLTTWPTVAPFHPSSSYYGFAHRGVIHAISAAKIEKEYIDSVLRRRVRVVVLNAKESRQFFPHFIQLLEKDYIRRTDTPANPDRLQVFVRKEDKTLEQRSNPASHSPFGNPYLSFTGAGFQLCWNTR